MQINYQGWILELVKAKLGLLIALSSLSLSAQNFDLENGPQGWQPHFADYEVGDSARIGLNAGHGQFDSVSNAGIYANADSAESDIFLCYSHAFDNLRPQVEYFVSYDIDFVTDETIGVGIGEPPAMAKVGALNVAPRAVDSNGTSKMNFNIGTNPYRSSKDLDTIGVLIHRDTMENYNHVINLKTRDSISVTTDSNGVFWAVIAAHQFTFGEASLKIAEIRMDITPFDLSEKGPELSEYSVYPNPASKYLQVEVNDDLKDGIYTITDLKGRKLKQGELLSETNRIDVNALKTGTYFLNIVVDESRSVRTFQVR